MLTDNKIKGLKPTEKRYSLSAGNGLSIDVMPTGRTNQHNAKRTKYPKIRNTIGVFDFGV